ncbi:hypothetical protein DSECCO2_322570 [anaerobic digester metagenome]
MGGLEEGVKFRKGREGRQILGDGLVQDVVGRTDVQAGRVGQGAAPLHKEVAVLDALDRLEGCAPGHFRQPGDKGRGHGGADVPGGIVEHDAGVREFRQIDQVHAPDQVVGVQDQALGRGLDGAPAGVVRPRVVAQERHVGHVRAGRHAFGHGPAQAAAGTRGQGVESRRGRGLQRGSPAKGIQGPAGHAVGHEKDGLHQMIL